MKDDRADSPAYDAPGVRLERAWVNELGRRRRGGPRMHQHGTLPAGFRGQSTIAIHAGTYRDEASGMVGTPIFQGTTFEFTERSYEAFDQGMLRDVPIYSRYGNPSQWAVQEKIAALEGAESALVFSSGMAAIASTLLALTSRGGHIVTSRDLYGGTYNLMREDMHRFGRDVTFVDTADPDAIASAITGDTQILFFETLTNPTLKPAPLKLMARLAAKNNLLLIVDNTFLTPYCFQPLEHGAHIVIHSATKYLNGHSDLVAGVAAGSRKYMDRVWQQMLKLGGSLNPQDCFLLERGLKTFSLRMRAHVDNAAAIWRFLSSHEKVLKVFSPLSYPWADKMFTRGTGGVVSFEVVGGDESGLRFLKALRLARTATSLGGVETLVSMPFNTSHSSLSARNLAEAGVRPGLVRLSVGVEDVEDLIIDLASALDEI